MFADFIKKNFVDFQYFQESNFLELFENSFIQTFPGVTRRPTKDFDPIICICIPNSFQNKLYTCSILSPSFPYTQYSRSSLNSAVCLMEHKLYISNFNYLIWNNSYFNITYIGNIKSEFVKRTRSPKLDKCLFLLQRINL